MFTFSQLTGAMLRKNPPGGTNQFSPFTRGYSGHGEGKNNPEMQEIHGVGPLPRGKYTMEVIKGEDGKPCDYEGKAAPVIRLIPHPETEMFGRAGMLIHGDFKNPELRGTASHGCVIENHNDRVKLAEAIESGDNQLEVV